MSTFEAAFKYQPNVNDSGKLGARFEHLLLEQDQLLRQINLQVPAPTHEAISDFETLPEERQFQILANIRFQNDVIVESSAERVPFDREDSKQFTREKELPYLMTALRKAGLRLGDSSILNYIEDDDIIEIYDTRGVQLYRSWSCYKYCTYSLAELLVYDWDTLYIRPAWVAKKLHEMAPALFVPGAGTMPYDLPEYPLTPRLMKSDKVLLFKMKYASPLICQDTRKTIAFLSTGKMTPVQKTDSMSQIHIL